MRWMLIWRQLVVLTGVAGATAALVASVISLNPPVSDALMIFVFLMMAADGGMGVWLVFYGVWRRVHGRWQDR